MSGEPHVPELTVTVINAGARVEHSVTTGTCAWELFRDDPAVIAARVGERQLDLSYQLKDGDELEGIDEPSAGCMLDEDHHGSGPVVVESVEHHPFVSRSRVLGGDDVNVIVQLAHGKLSGRSDTRGLGTLTPRIYEFRTSVG